MSGAGLRSAPLGETMAGVETLRAIALGSRGYGLEKGRRGGRAPARTVARLNAGRKFASRTSTSEPVFAVKRLRDALASRAGPIPAQEVTAAAALSPFLAALEGSGSVFQTVLALGLVVTVHECGHFAAARLQNIHVSKFSIGFGPCLVRARRDEVEYSIRLFPLGGFVAFPDDRGPEGNEDGAAYASDDPDLINNRPIKDRFAVISAGVVANMVMAFSILWGQTMNVGLMRTTYLQGVEIPELVGSSVAKRSGMKQGDVVVRVNETTLAKGERAVEQVVSTIKAMPEQAVTLAVKRGDKDVQLVVKPERMDDGTGRIGVQLAPNAIREKVKAQNGLEGAMMASSELLRLTKAVLGGFGNLIFHFQQNADKISGPVAMIAMGSEYSKNNFNDLLQFVVIINVNLAVLNTLPMPGLDGGQMAFLLAEGIRGGKKLPEGVESAINQSGFLFLFLSGIALLVRDTVRLAL